MTTKQPYPTRNYAVGEYLLMLRSRAKLTESELGARIGVHFATFIRHSSRLIQQNLLYLPLVTG
jgi:hypothetical protein